VPVRDEGKSAATMFVGAPFSKFLHFFSSIEPWEFKVVPYTFDMPYSGK